MPMIVDSKTYYRTTEACQMANISRSTLFRWLKEGVIRCNVSRDRNCWRLFTDDDVQNVTAEAARIEFLK
ncbi:MAG: MerR family transcriptional regulator [Chloroflexi bacterium]|jgi:excisionase family DNA binding protein|nr:MerR family transcriptional regulator [Chloroflexota bacterium]